MEFDDDGLAIPGTYSISTVRVSGDGADGEPVTLVQSAVCDVCGSWASGLYVAGTSTTHDSARPNQTRISRRICVFVYHCPAHQEQVIAALLDEYDGCSNIWDGDELADAVQKDSRMQWEANHR